MKKVKDMLFFIGLTLLPLLFSHDGDPKNKTTLHNNTGTHPPLEPILILFLIFLWLEFILTSLPVLNLNLPSLSLNLIRQHLTQHSLINIGALHQLHQFFHNINVGGVNHVVLVRQALY